MRSPVLDAWQCIFYGQFWNKKWNTWSFIFYILVSTLLQIVKKNIWWKHAITSLRLLLIFIRFQNDTTLKFNFKRLRKWNSFHSEEAPQKCCSKMLFYKNATSLQESTRPEVWLYNVAKRFYWNLTSAWLFSCKFAKYFQNTFLEEHFWGTVLSTK